MKHIILISALTASCFVSAPAFAQSAQTVEGNYVQLSLGSGIAGNTKVSIAGVGSENVDLDTGFFAALAGGHSMANGLALETEVLYLKNDLKTGSLDTLIGVPLKASSSTVGGMLNAQYAVAPVGPLVANVGAGIGFGQVEYKLLGESSTGTGFMWQAMAGLSYPVSPQVSWDLKYRYVRSPELRASFAPYNAKVETGTHVLAVGARFRF